ncbi:unnamed protein product [Lupinus luteus]|uniref:Knottins-like domain-containing protein n=1 Tax=Lupinus luteus TaxID=3873 RepID=A0AAV1WVE1_LUPLU
MARSAPIVFTIFFFVMLLLTDEMGPTIVVEGRTCLSRSQRFSGMCWRSSNCDAICNSENFPAGHCRGFRRRCYCTMQCPVNAYNNGPPPPNEDDDDEPVNPPQNSDGESGTSPPPTSR